MPFTYQNFRALILDAADCENEEQYVAEAGSSVAGDLDAEGIISILHLIWLYNDGGLAALRQALGLSRAALSREYGIPIRTLENWDAGVAEAPRYVSDLIAYAILIDANEK